MNSPLEAKLSSPERGPGRNYPGRTGMTNAVATPERRRWDTALGCPRQFLNNRFVYAVISQRARGLSIGINMNPDKLCNFDCAYCEVNRDRVPRDRAVDLKVLSTELQALL